MNIAPIKLQLKEHPNPNPRVAFKARPYPKHMSKAADKTVARLEELGIIAKVPASTPTKYTCHGFMVPKKSGDLLRLITDLTPINEDLERPVHSVGDVETVLSEIDASAQYILLADAKMGYYQIPIREEDQLLTTFLLPQGRFCYKRSPQGLSVSSDEWSRASTDALQGVPKHCKLVDDIAIWANSREELIKNFTTLLEACDKSGITLSRAKIKLIHYNF